MSSDKLAKPETEEKSSTRSYLAQIPRVLYAPQKAFKAIAKNPKYLGPILIMILFVAAYTASAYVFVSRGYNEQTLPAFAQGDEWTENSTSLWTSNAPVIAESPDCMGAGYYGNRSIEFNITDTEKIWMQLSNIGSVNCSGPEGYKNVSFRLKPIYSDAAQLANASIYLFSSQTDYFYYDLSRNITLFGKDTWNNFTLNLGTGNDWFNNGTNADWSNIVSLRFEITWTGNVNSTIRLDGLFFRGTFTPALKNVFNSMSSFSMFGFVQFVLRWVLLGVLLFIMTRGFGAATMWRTILVSIGFALVTMFVHSVVNIALFSTLPTIQYPFELMGGIEGELQAAINQVSSQTWLVSEILRYVQIAVYVWTVALCAMATRASSEVSWLKSALLATAAFFTSLVAESFILGV